jgi:hypothetical protein
MHSVRPDEAMARLFPQGPDISAQTVGPAMGAPPGISGAPAEGQPGGGGLDIMARLEVCLSGMADAARRLADARDSAQLSWDRCHVVPIAPGVSNAAGLIDDPDRWGPRAGWAWMIMRLTIVMTAGATATVYRDSPTSGHEMLYSINAGVWEPKGVILLPGQRMVVQASSQAVVNGDAVEIALDSLPAFLM